MYSFVVKYWAFYLVKKKKVVSYLQQTFSLGLYLLHQVTSEYFLNEFRYLVSFVELFG